MFNKKKKTIDIYRQKEITEKDGIYYGLPSIEKSKPILYPTITNKKLLDICLAELDGKWCNYEDKIPVEKISAIIDNCYEYLKPMEDIIRQTTFQRSFNEEGKYCFSYEDVTTYGYLSMRQIYCATLASRMIAEGKYSAALHEFMDCIDNYGETARDIRHIYINEYALYACILEAFKASFKDI